MDAALRNIAQWDGAEWQPLANDFDGEVYAVAGNNNLLCVSHRRNVAAIVGRSEISRWDGQQWTRLGVLQSTAPYGNLFVGPDEDLYVAGLHAGVESVVAPGLAHWTGVRWEPVFKRNAQGVAGIINSVYAFAEHEGSVYMGGIFLSAGDEFSDGLARWDGTNWHYLGNGWPGVVNAIAGRERQVFVGGALEDSEGKTTEAVLRWDGTNWTSLGSGVSDATGNAHVYALLARENDLFVGGRFTTAGGKPSASIARWVEHPRIRFIQERVGRHRSHRAPYE